MSPAPTTTRPRPPARAARGLCSGVIVSISVGALVLGMAATPASAAPSDDTIPTTADIARAKRSETTTAEQVVRIDGLLASANDDASAAMVVSLQAADRYTTALQVQQERWRVAGDAARAAEAADATLQSARTDVGRLASTMYRTAGVSPSSAGVIIGRASSDAMERAATAAVLADRRTRTVDTATRTAATARALRAGADDARRAAEDASTAADAARDAAESTASVQHDQAEQRDRERTVLIDRLAQLRDTTAALERKRVEAAERQRRAAALEAAITASRQQAAPTPAAAPVASPSPAPAASASPAPVTSAPPTPAASPSAEPAHVAAAEAPRPSARPVTRPAPTPAAASKPTRATPAVPDPAPPAPASPAPRPEPVVQHAAPAPEPAPAPAPAPAPSSAASSSAIRIMVQYAMSKVGVGTYVWGGNGPTGFDCSGLVQQAFASAGLSVPRGGTDQFWAAPTRVPLAQARYGDLLVFGSGPGFYHIAIYLGNNKVVHALNPSQGIMVNDLSELVGMVPYGYAARY